MRTRHVRHRLLPAGGWAGVGGESVYLYDCMHTQLLRADQVLVMAALESRRPQCDNQYNDSWFYTDIVTQLVPHTFGSMVRHGLLVHVSSFARADVVGFHIC